MKDASVAKTELCLPALKVRALRWKVRRNGANLSRAGLPFVHIVTCHEVTAVRKSSSKGFQQIVFLLPVGPHRMYLILLHTDVPQMSEKFLFLPRSSQG